MASGTSGGQKPKSDNITRRKRRTSDLAKNDGKFKEMIRMQEIARGHWEENWGFMKQETIDQIYREEALNRGLGADFMEKRRLKYHRETSEVPSIKLRPSEPVPKLSSGFCGWRSSIPALSLEIVGPLYVSPRHTIDPPRSANDIDLKHFSKATSTRPC